MKLAEIITKLDKSRENDANASYSDFEGKLDVDVWSIDYDKFTQRIQTYWINSWLCTDSVVGLAAYFLDGEFIAIMSQSGRKSPMNFTFVSYGHKQKLQKALLEMSEVEELKDEEEYLDMDEDVDLFYKIEFNSQASYHSQAYYKDTLVKLIHKNYKYDDFHTITIELDKDSRLDVDVRDLKFKIAITE